MQFEPDTNDPNLPTGVVICSCGGEISGRLDTYLLQQRVAEMPGVVYTAIDSFPCNREGRVRIQKAVEEHQLERVLVAGCTPRTVEKLFKQTALSAGLNANCIDVADIREQCVYVHENQPELALNKAVELIAMGIGRLQAVHLPETSTSEIIQTVLIIGAGFEALALARSLTRMGKRVLWVSDRQEIISSVQPLNESAGTMLKEQARLLETEDQFTAYLGSRIIEIDGHPGSYRAVVLQEQVKRSLLAGAIVLVTPGMDVRTVRSMAGLLNLPCNEIGQLVSTRRKLRPERYHGDGIFILSNTNDPSDTSAALFQVYQTAARIAYFLRDQNYSIELPVSEVDPVLCTGCGNCVQHCPTEAISLIKREGVLSLARVDPFNCMGCGNCIVSCPVHAIRIPGLEDDAILAQIDAITGYQRTAANGSQPRIIAFACEWGAYAAADLAGKHHLSYSPDVRLIRMNCSARFDPMHVLWAFLNGADGVMVGACPPGECHYSESNLRARERVRLLREQLAERGIDPRRLHLAFLPGDDENGFVDEINRFACTLREKVF